MYQNLETNIANPKTNVEKAIAYLGPWFHNLHLPCGTCTAPEHSLGDFPRYKWNQIESFLPKDLSGSTALDVGCNAGYYSFELAKRGATVRAIDVSDHYLTQASWAARLYGFDDRIKFEKIQIYDLAREEEQYDLVLFMGVLYHLRYPLLALDLLRRKVMRRMIVQTMTMPEEKNHRLEEDGSLLNRRRLSERDWPHLAFVEHRFQGDPTNRWVPNPAAIKAMLRSAGLKILAYPGHETFICKPDLQAAHISDRLIEEQYLSAVGQLASTNGLGSASYVE